MVNARVQLTGASCRSQYFTHSSKKPKQQQQAKEKRAESRVNLPALILLLHYPERRKWIELQQDGDDFPCVRLQKQSFLLLTKVGSHNSSNDTQFKCRQLLILARISAFLLFIYQFCSEQQSRLVQLLAGKSSNNCP